MNIIPYRIILGSYQKQILNSYLVDTYLLDTAIWPSEVARLLIEVPNDPACENYYIMLW
jgi:hypothetical protein